MAIKCAGVGDMDDRGGVWCGRSNRMVCNQMRHSGSGYSYDGHPFTVGQAIVAVIAWVFLPATLIAMAIHDFRPKAEKTLKRLGRQ